MCSRRHHHHRRRHQVAAALLLLMIIYRMRWWCAVKSTTAISMGLKHWGGTRSIIIALKSILAPACPPYCICSGSETAQHPRSLPCALAYVISLCSSSSPKMSCPAAFIQIGALFSSSVFSTVTLLPNFRSAFYNKQSCCRYLASSYPLPYL